MIDVFLNVLISGCAAILTLAGYKVIKDKDGGHVRYAKFMREIGDIQYRLESLENTTSKMNAKYSMRAVRSDNLEDIKAQIPDFIKALPLGEEEKQKLLQIIPIIPDNILKSFLK